jgi:hypothetical protein
MSRHNSRAFSLLFLLVLAALVALALAAPSPDPSSVALFKRSPDDFHLLRRDKLSGMPGWMLAGLVVVGVCSVGFLLCAAALAVLAPFAIIFLIAYAGVQGLKWIKNKSWRIAKQVLFVEFFTNHLKKLKEKKKAAAKAAKEAKQAKIDTKFTAEEVKAEAGVVLREMAKEVAKEPDVTPEAKAKLTAYANSPVTGKNVEKIMELAEKQLEVVDKLPKDPSFTPPVTEVEVKNPEEILAQLQALQTQQPQ